jgi:hypothetical protein
MRPTDNVKRLRPRYHLCLDNPIFHLTVTLQCLALKSEITLVRKKLHETESQNKKYHAELVAAETRADRLRSSTVLAMQARVSEDKKEPKGEEIEEPKPEAPPSPPVSGSANWWEFLTILIPWALFI